MSTATPGRMSELATMLSEMYLDVKLAVDESRFVGITPFVFTWGILGGLHEYGYSDRWCYESYGEAKRALDIWDGQAGTEPEGWHRHTPSWRRRPNGDASKEDIAP